MSADTPLLDKLNAIRNAHPASAIVGDELVRVYCTELHLRKLVDAEVAAAIERCQGAIIAMHTDPSAPQTRSLRYPDEWAHFERFVSEAVTAIGAIASTINKEGS